MVPKPSVFLKLFYLKIIGFKRGTFAYIHFDPNNVLSINPMLSKGVLSMISEGLLLMMLKGVLSTGFEAKLL
mgnify:CR=1 FL=1